MKKTQRKTQKKDSSGKKSFKMPQKKGIVDGSIALAATLGGILLANGITSVIPDSIKMPSQAGMAVVGILAGSSVNSNGISGKVLKGISNGIAIKGAYDLTTGGLQTLVTADPAATGVEKFIQGAVGLGCPGGCPGGCDGGYAPAYVNGLGNPFLIDTVYDEGTDTYGVAKVSSGVSAFL